MTTATLPRVRYDEWLGYVVKGHGHPDDVLQAALAAYLWWESWGGPGPVPPDVLEDAAAIVVTHERREMWLRWAAEETEPHARGASQYTVFADSPKTK